MSVVGLGCVKTGRSEDSIEYLFLSIAISDTHVVECVEEGYDLAVRISRGGSPALVGRRLTDRRRR